jgi:hypothetical protein
MTMPVKSIMVAGWWVTPSTPVSPSNKIDCYDITEIMLKVALNTITTIQESKNHNDHNTFLGGVKRCKIKKET